MDVSIYLPLSMFLKKFAKKSGTDAARTGVTGVCCSTTTKIVGLHTTNTESRLIYRLYILIAAHMKVL